MNKLRHFRNLSTLLQNLLDDKEQQQAILQHKSPNVRSHLWLLFAKAILFLMIEITISNMLNMIYVLVNHTFLKICSK